MCLPCELIESTVYHGLIHCADYLEQIFLSELNGDGFDLGTLLLDVERSADRAAGEEPHTAMLAHSGLTVQHNRRHNQRQHNE